MVEKKWAYLMSALVVSLLTGCHSNTPDKDAVVCFNPKLYQAGNEFNYQLVSEHLGGPFVTKDRSKVYIKGHTSKQQGKMVAHITSESRHEGKVIRQSESHYQIIPQKAQYLLTDTKADHSNTHFTPGVIFSYALDKGESSTHQVVIKIDHSKAGKKPALINMKQETQFIGIEPITVKAGKFASCHFRYRSQTQRKVNDPSASKPLTVDFIEDYWYAKETGAVLKIHKKIRFSDDNNNGGKTDLLDSEQTLVSGTIAGKPIKGKL